MESLKRWSKSILFDAALAIMFYSWKVNHIEGAGNAFLFVMWLSVVLGLIAVREIAKPNANLSSLVSSPAFRAYQIISDLAYVLALAWFGHFVLAGLYALVAIVFANARTKANKLAEVTP